MFNQISSRTAVNTYCNQKDFSNVTLACNDVSNEEGRHCNGEQVPGVLPDTGQPTAALFLFLNCRFQLLLLPGQQEGVNQPGNQEGDQPQEADAKEKVEPLSGEKESQEEARLSEKEV